MYKALQQLVRPEELNGDVLSISHSRYLTELLAGRSDRVTEGNYPIEKIERLSYADNRFSAVVSDQVLEHVGCTPTEAVDEVWRVLRVGGLAIHTTCFIAAYHGATDLTDLANGDFWRFTPSGLRLLHHRYSSVEVGGWGNLMIPFVNLIGCRRMPVPEASWHPLNWIATTNRTSYPHMVWVVARK